MATSLRGVLFDVDGTLVDSTYFHTLAWWHGFRRFGHDVRMNEIHRLVGMGGQKIVERLLGPDRDASQDSEIMDTHAAVFSTFWPHLRPFDGARELLGRCKEAGLAVVLASSAREQDLTVLRSVVDAEGSVDAATSSADADEPKPAPDILEAALRAVGLEASEVVFVGDAVWDVQASSALGIPTIGLSCGGYSAAELEEAGAAEVFASPRDLMDAFGDSLIGRGLAGAE
ncbi:HAD superfamily hydrolase (TIGR01509 family) [Sinomonas atrocyanea]|jgi:HAD superfamily hydrolase (TIGR01509 family)|uniref:HAD family hydrolase n=1 Tax=Sinomonas atrocyanea TaxID=37927 RepID=UPI00278803FA|nr:HAD family hydrolase [Sinomonas atrocyanea]MDP9884163.1 HAD superfamily hydrolase (TIGR01509 family) [Sinomonas atrocyanea]